MSKKKEVYKLKNDFGVPLFGTIRKDGTIHFAGISREAIINHFRVVDREEKQGVFPDEIPSSSSVSSPTKEVTPLLSRMKCAFPDKNKNTTHDDYVLWADVLCCLKEFKEAYYIEVLRDKEYPEWAYNDFCKMVKRFFGGEEK